MPVWTPGAHLSCFGCINGEAKPLEIHPCETRKIPSQKCGETCAAWHDDLTWLDGLEWGAVFCWTVLTFVLVWTVGCPSCTRVPETIDNKFLLLFLLSRYIGAFILACFCTLGGWPRNIAATLYLRNCLQALLKCISRKVASSFLVMQILGGIACIYCLASTVMVRLRMSSSISPNWKEIEVQSPGRFSIGLLTECHPHWRTHSKETTVKSWTLYKFEKENCGLIFRSSNQTGAHLSKWISGAFLLPVLMLFFLEMRVFYRGTAVTEKCRIVPAFVNQIPSEPWIRNARCQTLSKRFVVVKEV